MCVFPNTLLAQRKWDGWVQGLDPTRLNNSFSSCFFFLWVGSSPALQVGLDPSYPAWSLVQPCNQVGHSNRHA